MRRRNSDDHERRRGALKGEPSVARREASEAS